MCMTMDIEDLDKIFPIVDPSELIGHKILEHRPRTVRQEKILNDILKGIELNLPAFRVQSMDPSEEFGQIVFKPGNKPAVGYSPIWWKRTLKKFMPSKNSRNGNELQWAAFLGKQMKYLVEERHYSVSYAWRAVCDDSYDLGHYWNSDDAKYKYELTGRRRVGEFFDLANTCKILKKSNASGFLFASGTFNCISYESPLANMVNIYDSDCNYSDSVGWLVLDV